MTKISYYLEPLSQMKNITYSLEKMFSNKRKGEKRSIL